MKLGINQAAITRGITRSFFRSSVRETNLERFCPPRGTGDPLRPFLIANFLNSSAALACSFVILLEPRVTCNSLRLYYIVSGRSMSEIRDDYLIMILTEMVGGHRGRRD
jgi:hypothetical protein